MVNEKTFSAVTSLAIRRRAIEAVSLSAKIRRSADGVRIRFSDGRISWFNKEPNVSDAVFLRAVIDWTRRRGAQTVEIDCD